MVYFTKYFKHYLVGKQFLLRIDHSSIRWLLSFKDPEGQVARWIEALSEFDMKIEHRPGKQHGNAEGLSRMSCRQCGFTRSAVSDTEHKEVSVGHVEDVSQSLVDLQKHDSDFKVVRSWVTEGKRHSADNIKSGSYFLKSLWNQWGNLLIRDNLLCHKWSYTVSGTVYYQAVVPFSERLRVLQKQHDDRPSGHLGIRKTLAKVSQRYYWPGMRGDVKAYVNGCDTCLRKKIQSKRSKFLRRLFKLEAPWKDWPQISLVSCLRRRMETNIFSWDRTTSLSGQL